MASLARLPDETVASLRSSFILTSFLHAVEELVHNALDANATRVEVSVNRSQWLCRVKDNGAGLGPADMANLAQRHWTSKNIWSPDRPFSAFGFRGEALASMAAIASLEFSSKTGPDQDTYTLQMRGGNLVYCGLAKGSRYPDAVGTTVQIRDLFYKWPVRRKTAGASIEQIRRMLDALALVFPHVGFSLHNLEKQDTKVFSLARAKTVQERWDTIFGSTFTRDSFEVDFAQDYMVVRGFMSTTAARSKQLQFISVNGRPVRLKALHNAINALFTSSSFAQTAQTITSDLSPSKRQKLNNEAPFPKDVDRFPVFCLALTLPSTAVDITVDPDKKAIQLVEQDEVVAFLEEVTSSFLRRQGWLRGVPKTNQSAATTLKPKPRPTVSAVAPLTLSADLLGEGQSKWIDPQSGQAFVVDQRTGHTRTLHEHNRIKHAAMGGTSHQVDASHLKEVHDPTQEQEKPQWLADVLSEPAAPAHTPAPAAQPCIACCHLSDALLERTKERRPFLLATYKLGQQHVTRADLAKAAVIGQVDRKFILCRLADSVTLFLVDQHAADERVRVERLLSELCAQAAAASVPVVELNSPHLVLVTRAEHRMLSDSSHGNVVAAFNKWGLGLELLAADADGDGDYLQVGVTHVPAVVERRLRNEPQLIREFIDSFILQLEDQPQSGISSNQDWVGQLGYCPKVLRELVNSKACRGAIMFNDELTAEDCQKLVQRLAQTRFPFQCAHGRPSLVPLMSLAPMSAQSW